MSVGYVDIENETGCDIKLVPSAQHCPAPRKGVAVRLRGVLKDTCHDQFPPELIVVFGS